MSGAARIVGEIGTAMSPAGIAGTASGLGSMVGKGLESVAGGIGGMFGGKKNADTGGLQAIQDAALGMYNEGSADYAAQKDNRAALSQQLADRALGKAPSIAEAQMRQAGDRSLSQQLAAAKANKAVNPALAFRQTQRLGAESGQNIAQASGIAKLQEAGVNQQAFQNHLNSMQNSRFSALGAGSGAAQGIAAANAAQAQSDNAFMGNLLGTGATIGSMMALAPVAASDARGKKNISPVSYKATAMSDENEKVEVQRVESPQQDFQTLVAKLSTGNPMEGVQEKLKAGGQFAEALAKRKSAEAESSSDKNNKAEIQSFSPKSFLDKLQAYEYEYKDPSAPGAGEGKHVSVMAQDLEKAGPVGKSMVQNTAHGKMVDYGKGFGAMLAAQADLNRRLAEIETSFGPKKKKV